ncbi:MAG: hypothetical protein H8E82_02260 [Candidatus Marinimicrobia bacterium]|nr:hypothetical protein [Candidatus Neomarinimicrobiota bacterium]MBL7047168.1 hypothetical protein [Candidatus Neomarinimicrobiota bacterium]
MSIFDRIVLLLTGLVLIYMIWYFIKRQKSPETAGTFNLYYIVSFLVFLVAGLLLIAFGWDALGHPFVAVVAGLIPFGLAIGLIAQFYPDNEKKFLWFFIVGLILIAIYKFALPDATWGKVIYPIFHAVGGLTIFLVPIFVVKGEKVPGAFVNVTIGGALIGLGGIALAFLTAGSQLLFFSQEFVLAILSPLLFLTALFFALGFVKGESG